MSRSDRQVNFRLNEELLERLRMSAADSGRSLTAELNHQLDKLAPVLPVHQVKVRIPSDLRQHVEASAKKNGRSISSEIVCQLQAAYSARAEKRGASE